MPRGGARSGSGRPKGKKGKSSPRWIAPKTERQEVATAAREYTEQALAALVAALDAYDPKSRSPLFAVQVAAATALLDRGYGRPRQAVDLGVNRPVVFRVIHEARID